MKKIIKKKLRQWLVSPVLQELVAHHRSSPVEQANFIITCKKAACNSMQLTFDDVGFRCFSQTNEDGILLYIFSLIGTKNKRSIEICSGNGMECNTANLIINHNWNGLLVDGDAAKIKTAKEFYNKHPDTGANPPLIEHSWITRSSINDLFEKKGFRGEIDLLSIDMDGVDYWIWKEITIVNPRVVVLEFQSHLGARPISIPYLDNFDASSFPQTKRFSNYLGASLTAFVKLGTEKGYRLIGFNRGHFNAFFLRDDIHHDSIQEASVDHTLNSLDSNFNRMRWKSVEHLNWETV